MKEECPMIRSINAWSVPPAWTFVQVFENVAKAGFEAIELNVDTKGASLHALAMDTTAEELKRVRDLSRQHNLPVTSISTSLYGDKLGGPGRDRRDQARVLLEKQLEYAEALGADGVLVVPGGISEDWSIQAAWGTAQESIAAMRSLIEGAPAKVGVENVWNRFFMSPFDMVRFIDGLRMNNLGAYFDVGNVAVYTQPEYWIEILGQRIVKIHVKDYQAGGVDAKAFVNLMQGGIRWRRVVRALKQAGYDGALTAELGLIPAAPDYLLDITNEALRRIIAMGQEEEV
jgi:L-ribulose-5-phosphate 3-epimerase